VSPLPELGPPPTKPLAQGDLEWWLNLAPMLSWRNASTFTDSAPHSYVIRDKTMDDPDCTRAVQVIRTYGQPGKFYGSTQIYLQDPDDPNTRWWTMSGTISQQGVINRSTDGRMYGKQDAPVTAQPLHNGQVVAEVVSLYDHLATVYDSMYDASHCPPCTQENDAVRRLIVKHFGFYAPRTLDVGCGTGLLLDMKVTSPDLYTGLDPSQGMLNALVLKHPKVTHLVPARLEDAVSAKRFVPKQFELVASLFGSPSYIEPVAIEALPSLTSDLLLLMHYRAGYWPDYWPHQPVMMDESREAALALPGAEHFTINNMVVTLVDVRR